MEVKHILEKVRQQKKEPREYFFALQIEKGFVKSAIWAVFEGRVKVLSFGGVQEWDEREGLIEAVDASLSSVVEQLPAEEDIPEPNKVIFGLPSAWVKGEKIVETKIGLLKEISQKLDLKPAGFVVTIEAIVHHLKDTEGVPPTLTIVGLRKEKMVVTLTRLGKIIGIQVVKRSDQLGADLAEGLLRFESQEQFPARILLYQKGSGLKINLEEARQELADYSWSEEQIEFLHLPKTEILPEDFDIKAVVLAGGQEVAKAEGIEVLARHQAAPGKKGTKDQPASDTSPPFGFVKEKDIVQTRHQTVLDEGELEVEEVAKKPEVEKVVSGEKKKRLSLLKKPRFRLPFFRLRLPRFRPKIGLAFPRFSLGRRGPAVVILVGGLLLVLIVVLVACYWYLPRAEILLLAKAQKLEKELEVQLDPSLKAVDPEGLKLPAEGVKVTLEDEGGRETTGVKMVGDPAKGEVVIYNRTSAQKTFEVGVKIVGPGGLEFTLDEEVAVASESAGEDYSKVPGKVMTTVTAVEIGTEGNLAAQTEFTIDEFAKSDFVAKSESAFSGGTSREVQVVSAQDQKKLLTELKEGLEEQAKEKLRAKIPEGKKLLEESLATEVLKKSFLEREGEEANKVRLKLEVEATALVYDEGELRVMIEDEIRRSIPSDFEYKEEKSEIAFELKEMAKDGSATFGVRFSADLVPKFDLDQVRANVAGKYPHIGQTYLENLSYVEAVEIKITPRLPSRLLTFPRVIDRIKIEVDIE